MERGGIIKHEEKNASKTGDWRYMKPKVDAEKCIGCGTCVEHCPEGVIELVERQNARLAGALAKRVKTLASLELGRSGSKRQNVAEIDFEYCKGCGVCAAVCPFKAISMRK